MSSDHGIPRTVALDRAIDVLSAVAQSAEPASASALARSTEQPRATVSRTLRTLADCGLVTETPAGWVLGNELFRLARGADPHRAVIEAATGPLRALRDRADESALLAIVTGRTRMEIVTQLDAAHRLGVVGWVGADIPLHASSAGKLVLAELSPSELEAWFDGRPAGSTLIPDGDDRRRARRRAPRVRRRGWADIVDELEDGLASLSAPIRDSAGELVAAIGLSGPTFRLGATRRRQLLPVRARRRSRGRARTRPCGTEPTRARGLSRSDRNGSDRRQASAGVSPSAPCSRPDVQRRGRPDHPEHAAAHAEPPRVDGRGRLDLQPVLDLLHRRVELERRHIARRFETAHDAQRPTACIPDMRRDEPHQRVCRDSEEVGRAQVLVPHPVARVDAVGVDRQLDHRPVRAGLGRAVEAVEAAANGREAPERLDGEVDGTGIARLQGNCRPTSRARRGRP